MRRRPSPDLRRHAGFTLIEMIVSLVVMGMLAVIMVPLLRMPTSAYLEAETRTEMLSQVSLVRSKMEEDLRQALPGSLRHTQVGAVHYVEFLQMRAYGRYRANNGGPTSCPAACGQAAFTASCAETCFTTIGELSEQVVPTLNSDRVVIDPLGVAGPYNANTSSVITAYSQQSAAAPIVYQLIFGARTFPAASTTVPNRFYIVSQPVTYVCTPGPAGASGTLLRRWGYTLQAAQPTTFTNGRSALLSNRISDDVATACNLQVRIEANGTRVLTAQLELQRPVAGMPVEPVQTWMEFRVREP